MSTQSKNSTTSSSANVLDPKDLAMKTRIITHMNADHADSLSLFAQYYSRLPVAHANTAKIIDITPQYMIIESSFGRNLIQFDPPMSTLMESRPRLVEMHTHCLRELGYAESGVKVTRYLLPYSILGWTSFLFIALIWVTFPFRQSLLPESGSIISKIWSIGGLVPGLARLSYTMQPISLGIMTSFHITEAWYFMAPRLKKYQVAPGSTLWWKWISDTLMEGYASWIRFDAEVKRLEDKKKKDTAGAKH